MTRAEKRKYHYIYKTTCTVTGKYYIGMHSTDDLNDGYVGSGKRLWYSINKHGKENHVCEILEFLPDRKALKEREAELVCEDKLIDPLCMNLKTGGEGGWDHIQSDANHKEWTKRGRFNADIVLNEKNITKQDLGIKASLVLKEQQKGFAFDIELRKQFGFEFNKKNQQLGNSKDARIKAAKSISESHAINGWQVGEKNSQFGTCWICSTIEQRSMKVSKSEVQIYLNSGWSLGRKFK